MHPRAGKGGTGASEEEGPLPRNLYGFNGNFPASLWLTDLIL